MTGHRASFGLAGLMACALGGQLGLMRPTFAPEDESGGGIAFELPADTPMDPGFTPGDPVAPRERPAAPAADPGDDDFEDDEDDEGGEGDPPAGERREARQPGADEDLAALTPEQLRERLENTQRALNAARARARVQARQRSDAGLPTAAPAAREPERPAEPEELIDFDTDPIAAGRQMQALIRNYQANERAREESEAASRRQAQQYEAIQSAMNEYEADFRASHPDYGAAVRHLATETQKELAAFGVPQAQLPGLIRHEFARRVALAIQAGLDPAEVFYNTARSRGYQPAGRANQGGDARRGEGGRGSTPESLERIRKGQKLGSPLSRGASATRGIDAATLASIDIRSDRGGKAFDAAWDAYEAGEKARERAAGGRVR